MTKQDLLDPLLHFLEIPSVSTQDKYLPEMERSRHYLVDIFHQLGFKTKILKGVKHDAVFASLTTHYSLPTTLIYGHYDVQPPEPLEEWTTPPFEPKIDNDEIFARGSADDKGQVMIHLMAIKRLLTDNLKLKTNLKFIIEGEEEIGSISIDNFAIKYLNDLSCDYLIVSDTGMPKKGQPAINTGLRGLVYTEVEIQTGKHDLHSGGFGGVAENPAIVLSRLISDLKFKNGKINIPGFYTDVLIPESKEINQLRKFSETPEDIMKEGGLFGIGGGELKYSMDERKYIRPTLDVNGIWSGYVEAGSKTIIPSKATAKISMRLVPNQNPDKIFVLFERQVKKLLPDNIKFKIKRYADCLPYLAPTKHPIFTVMAESLKNVYQKQPVFKKVSGSIGFVPIMAKVLNVPVLMVGFALPGANIHAPNEHFNLTNYYQGIKVMEHFYSNIRKFNDILPALKGGDSFKGG